MAVPCPCVLIFPSELWKCFICSEEEHGFGGVGVVLIVVHLLKEHILVYNAEAPYLGLRSVFAFIQSLSRVLQECLQRGIDALNTPEGSLFCTLCVLLLKSVFSMNLKSKLFLRVGCQWVFLR